MVISAGVGWFTFPVFVKPLEIEFGWTRMQINGAVGLWGLVTGAFSPLLGHWIDRFGARRIMLAGVLLGGLCSVAFGGIQSLGHLYTVMFFAAFGTAASTYIPVASVISRWFAKKRGVAMSIAMMGMGLGGFIMPNASNLLIEMVGWRWAFRIFGLVVWAVLTPVVAIWIHHSPSDLGLKPNGDNSPEENQDDAPGEASADGFTVRQALGTPNFWCIGMADFFNGMAVVGITINMVAFSIDAGIGEKTAAFAYSLIMGVMLLGMVAVGAAADRYNRRGMISLSYGGPAAVVMLLFGLESSAPLLCFSILSGICGAGRATLWPLVVNDCFGRRAYATVMGFLMIFYTVGSAVGPPLAGYIFDTTGSYHRLFVLSIAAFAISGILMAVGARPRMEADRAKPSGRSSLAR